MNVLACGLISPGGKRLGCGIRGGSYREIIRGRFCGMSPGVDVVGDKGIGEFKNDIHLDGIWGQPALECSFQRVCRFVCFVPLVRDVRVKEKKDCDNFGSVADREVCPATAA